LFLKLPIKEATKMGDLYKLLLRKEAKLLMQVEVFNLEGKLEHAQEARDQKELIQKKRLGMKRRLSVGA